MFNTTGTALLTIDYRGTSAANSIAGATAALDSDRRCPSRLAEHHPRIRWSRPGAQPRRRASKSVAVLVAIGVIVGIALGLLLIVVWERVDPRIDRPEDLSQEVGSPTSPVSAISESGVNALIARWKALAERGPSRIALVPVTPDVQSGSAEGRAHVQPGPDDRRRTERRGGTLVDPDTAITSPAAKTSRSRARIGTPAVIACEVPSADLTALRSIMDCDLVVLVARRGTPRAALRESLDSLTEFGVSPKWAIFLGARAAGLPGRARSPMSVSTVRPRDGRRVQASSTSRRARAAAAADGSAWLRTGWSRALFTVGASVAVGIAAGLGTKTAVAALFGVAVVVIVLARPVIGAYTLVAVVPPVSGLRAGLPVPQLRPAEVLIGSVGVLLLVIARPGQTPRWRAFDWCALGYAVANAGLGAVDLVIRGCPDHARGCRQAARSDAVLHPVPGRADDAHDRAPAPGRAPSPAASPAFRCRCSRYSRKCTPPALRRCWPMPRIPRCS